MEIEVYTHSRCAECTILLQFLRERNLLDKVRVIDTEKYPFLALEKGVLSTPSIFVDGKLLYAGVVDFGELEEILVKGEVRTTDVQINELIDRLMNGVVNSFAMTDWLFLNPDPDALMDQKDFVLAVTGLIKDPKRDEKLNSLHTDVRKNWNGILEAWKIKMMKNIASNFVREIYWLYERKIPKEEVESMYPLEVFAHWMMVRGGAVGRVGLRIMPLSDTSTLSRIAEVYEYLTANYDQILDRIASSEAGQHH